MLVPFPGVHPAAEILDHDWEPMVSFYRYPKEDWVHPSLTNPIESKKWSPKNEQCVKV